MRPIDIQNALDRVNAGERLLHVRKVQDGESTDNFAKRLNEEAEQKSTSITEAEQTDSGQKVEEDGGGKNQFEGQNKKQKKREEKSEEETRVKEDGKGSILDLDA